MNNIKGWLEIKGKKCFREGVMNNVKTREKDLKKYLVGIGSQVTDDFSQRSFSSELKAKARLEWNEK